MILRNFPFECRWYFINCGQACSMNTINLSGKSHTLVHHNLLIPDEQSIIEGCYDKCHLLKHPVAGVKDKENI